MKERFIECGKPQRTVWNGPQGFFAIWCGTLKIIFLGHRRLLKTKKLLKKRQFPVKKIVWPIFSRLIECKKPQRINYKGQKSILTLFVEFMRCIVSDLRGCWKHWKHNFLKKRQLFQWSKKVWPISSRFIECEKPQRINYKGQKGILTLFVEVMRRFV